MLKENPQGHLGEEEIMDIQVKIFSERVDSWEIGEALRKTIEGMGFKCYGTGYDIIDHYRELVFNKKKERKKK